MAFRAQEFATEMLTNRKFGGDFVSTLYVKLSCPKLRLNSSLGGRRLAVRLRLQLPCSIVQAFSQENLSIGEPFNSCLDTGSGS